MSEAGQASDSFIITKQPEPDPSGQSTTDEEQTDEVP